MTRLSRWRDSNPSGLADVVVTAAQHLGVRPLAVAKDYWACEALRAIAARIGRQFYDVWALLGNEEVLAFLADKPLATKVLASCYEVSQAFTPDLPIPDRGFAVSSAFIADGPLAPRLRAEHDAAMKGLHYGIEAPPSFADVLDRVHAHADLLVIG